MTTPLLIVTCLAVGLAIAMLTDLLRDLSGRHE
jgi:hypothetical protein